MSPEQVARKGRIAVGHFLMRSAIRSGVTLSEQESAYFRACSPRRTSTRSVSSAASTPFAFPRATGPPCPSDASPQPRARLSGDVPASK